MQNGRDWDTNKGCNYRRNHMHTTGDEEEAISQLGRG